MSSKRDYTVGIMQYARGDNAGIFYTRGYNVRIMYVRGDTVGITTCTRG